MKDKKHDDRKKASEDFERFDDLLRQVIAVPKDEIKEREQKEKRRKDEKKKS